MAGILVGLIVRVNQRERPLARFKGKGKAR